MYTCRRTLGGTIRLLQRQGLVGAIGTLISRMAYFLCALVTRFWRFLSEFLRADYQGIESLSVYQVIAPFTTGYAACVFTALPVMLFSGDIIESLRLVWNPSIIMICQILWIGIFLHMSRSQVTGSRISFHVRKDHI